MTNLIHQLTDLEVTEVSLVNKAANKKKFLILKNEGIGEVQLINKHAELDQQEDNVRRKETYVQKMLRIAKSEQAELHPRSTWDHAMDSIAKQMQQPGETIEAAHVRASTTPEYAVFYEKALEAKPPDSYMDVTKSDAPTPYDTASWQLIEVAAEKIQKGLNCTKEQAIDVVLRSPVGKQWNEEHEREQQRNFNKVLGG